MAMPLNDLLQKDVVVGREGSVGSLGKTEKQYANYQGEMLAVVWAAFNFTVKCRRVVSNANADVPSRFPRKTTQDETGARLDMEEIEEASAAPDRWCMYLALNVPVRGGGSKKSPAMSPVEACVRAGLEMLLRNGVKVNKYLYQDVSEHSKRVAKVRCAEMVRQYPAQLKEAALRLEALPDDMKLTARDMLIQQGALTGYGRAGRSNLHDKAQFDSLMKSVDKQMGHGRDRRRVEPREVQSSDRFPHYRCNVVGKPMMALPTIIMATQASHAFRGNRAGTVVSKGDTGFIREVDLDEKVRAMGYSADILRRSSLSNVELQVVLGMAMDRRAMEVIYAVSEVVTTTLVARAQGGQPAGRTSSLIKPYMTQEEEWVEVKRRKPMQAGMAAWLSHSSKFAAEQSTAVEDCSWDGICQRLVNAGVKDRRDLGQKKPSPYTEAQRRRTWQLELWRPSQYDKRARTTFVKARGAKESRIEIPDQGGQSIRLRLTGEGSCQSMARSYRWNEVVEGELYLITVNAKEVRVPKPEDRLDLTREYRERTGHWGCKRTEHLLCQKHWWSGIWGDVLKVMQQCEICGRVKTDYAKEEALLYTLDIKSCMYKWSLDLMKPGKVTAAVAAGYWNHVMSVFGAPAQCLVDGGGEFEGGFEKLCESCRIDTFDRRVTSPDSPEVGQRLGAERVVCIIKFCLKKCALVHGLNFEWDQFLWAIVLNYNAAKQQSITG
eukprot:gene34192-biopygen19197